MNEMPESVTPALRRLARRLAIGVFLDVWPTWAVASLLAAGLVALVCRMFFPGATSGLDWLWLAPVLSVVLALITCFMRAYRPAEVVAVADWLTGGQGMLLTMHETGDAAWAESSLLMRASTLALPRLRPWRKLAPLVPALAFMVAALALPQRVPRATNTILAEDIAGDLKTTLLELKQQELMVQPLAPLSLPYSPEFEPRPDPDEGRKALREIARVTGGIERTTWDDVFSAMRLRNRQVKDLVIPLTLMLLILHVVEVGGRRLLLFDAARAWLRTVRLPRLPRPRLRPRPAVASPERADAASADTPPVAVPKPATSPLARAKAKARGRMRE